MDSMDVSLIGAVSLFIIFDANHFINNSDFHNFYQLDWFYQISDIYSTKWLNSNFSNGKFKMFLYSERSNPVNISLVEINNSFFSHLFCQSDFFFKWTSANMSFLNSYFENLTLHTDGRSWLRGDESYLVVSIYTLDSCGCSHESVSLLVR